MLYIIIAAAVLAVDILTKITAMKTLMNIDTIPIINGVLHFTYVENRGMAFGLFDGGRVVFIVVSVIVLGLLTYMVCKTQRPLRTIWLRCGAALVFGGAIGNLLERIFRGYVVDFIDFRLIDFPVFNVADIAVCIGAAMLVIHFLAAENKASKKNSKNEAQTAD